MFSKETILKIEELDLVQVITHYVDLKQKGVSWVGKSPFTEEKTGSFYVTPGKNVWKCFSSGIGGNSPISFVMKKGALSFPEAIHELAGKFNIDVEYDNDRGAEMVDRANRVREISDMNLVALEFFQDQLLGPGKSTDRLLKKNLPDDVMKQAQRLSIDQIHRFDIGYAPNTWDALKNHLLSKGYSVDMMVRAGLVIHKADESGAKNYDAFRNRIMFPVFTHSGRLTGFSGRDCSNDTKAQKVLNTASTDAFKKAQSMLGISLAKPEIIKMQFAVKVEGNFDITSFHEKGLLNTVCTLGTAFTENHAELIKRYTSTLVSAIDNDDAGIKSVEKDLPVCLEKGLSMYIWVSDIEKEDPFDFCQRNAELSNADFIQKFNESRIDALDWLASAWYKEADTVQTKTAAQNKIGQLLALIPDAALRNNYVKDFAKKYDISRKDIEQQVSTTIASKKAKEMETSQNNGVALPSYLSEESMKDWNDYQFFGDEKEGKIGYYVMNSANGFERVSNFTLRPIFQVESRTDSKRIVEIRNYSGNKFNNFMVELPNKATVSLGEFEIAINNLPNCWYHASKRNFQKMRVKWLAHFAYCREIRTLGWQPEGFFAFANGIVENGFKQVDQYGICLHSDRKYFLPAFSKLYDGQQIEDDVYENDRRFVYRPSRVFTGEWATLFCNVYKEEENGMIGVGFLISVLFSDLIFSTHKYFPLLFGFGQPRTGKSTFGRSISSIYKSNTIPFSLNHGTPIAFNRRLSRGRNIVEHLDEYRNDLEEKRFQGLKAIFDRMGHEKGMKTNDNRTEITRIESAAYVSGQHMPTRDGNALFSRSMFLNFGKTVDKFTKEELKAFQKLQELEKGGLSNVIVEIVKYRDLVEQEYAREVFDISGELMHQLKGETVDKRVLDNFCVLLCLVKLLGEKLNLPFTYAQMCEVVKEKVTKQSDLIYESDDLAEFFTMIEYLYQDHKIDRSDFNIITKDEISVRINNKENKRVGFGEPVKLLQLNLGRIMQLYQQYTRAKTGQPGLPTTTIKSYMHSHKAFVGTEASVSFNGMRTSSYTFRYDDVNVSLEKDEFVPPVQQPSPPINNYNTPPLNSWRQSEITEDGMPV